jgi:hypothetical protein
MKDITICLRNAILKDPNHNEFNYVREFDGRLRGGSSSNATRQKKKIGGGRAYKRIARNKLEIIVSKGSNLVINRSFFYPYYSHLNFLSKLTNKHRLFQIGIMTLVTCSRKLSEVR